MELVDNFIDIILHLDEHLNWLVQNYGTITYLVLFLVIFCETGLVVTPFLPGDSLLFAIGAISANGSLKLWFVWGLLWAAAIFGDFVNYWIGYFLGFKVLQREKSRFIKKEYLERTQKFYEKHGGKTIILARFIPIIRTFAPFVAGIGRMNYGRFLMYNCIGGIAWVTIFIFAGYFFGNIPIVKENFTLVVMAIVVISVLPAVFEFIHQRRQMKKERLVKTNQ